MQWSTEKGQTTTYTKLLKIEQHESHEKPGANSGAPEGAMDETLDCHRKETM